LEVMLGYHLVMARRKEEATSTLGGGRKSEATSTGASTVVRNKKQRLGQCRCVVTLCSSTATAQQISHCALLKLWRSGALEQKVLLHC